MKLGLIISAAIIVIVSLVLFFALRTGPPDMPTKATTAPGKLDAVEVKAGLPPMWETTAPDVNANELYRKAFDFFLQNRTEFVSSRGEIRKDFDGATADRLVDLLIEASKAGKVSAPFLDDQIPITPKSEPTFKDALELVPAIVERRAKEQQESSNSGRAITAAQACWALGQRALEKSVRYYPRATATNIMWQAGANMMEWNPDAPNLESQLNAWSAELVRIKALLDERGKIIAVLRPHQGDLINLARNDKDLGCRAEGILMVGVLKYNPREGNAKGNLAAFEEIMDEASAESDPLISQAGKAAKALTKEDMRRLR